MRVSRQRCFSFRHSRKRQPRRRPRRASSTLADIRWITRLTGIGGLTTPPFPQWRLARLVGVDHPKRLLQKSPIDRPRQLHQRVFHIDDLVNFARCVGSRAAQKSRAKAGLSLQEEPSNVTFTIDDYQTSAAVCTRDVMAITKMRFLPCVCLHRVDEVARER